MVATYAYTNLAGGFGDFTVVKSTPSGAIVVFTITDTANLLTNDPKMIRSVLADAIDQWIALERADLDTNGDSAVKGSSEFDGVGDGFSEFAWDFDDKTATVTLTALTNISSTGNLTVSIPYADVV